MVGVRRSPLLLQSIERKGRAPLPDDFPFNVPVVQSLSGIEFTSSITFFVGENGSGKFTLLEAIACAVGSVTRDSLNNPEVFLRVLRADE